MQLLHIIFAGQVLVAHPETFVQIHEPVLDENDVQQVNDVRTEISAKPVVGVFDRLEWERRTQRNDPGVVQKRRGHDAQP